MLSEVISIIRDGVGADDEDGLILMIEGAVPTPGVILALGVTLEPPVTVQFDVTL